MLQPSRLYSFLDHKNGVNIQFLEGQKLIEELVLTHPLKGSGFAYYREILLGVMPIIFFLKPGESIGIYIDSSDPYFRLKIETNSAGHTRSLLLPADFGQFPMKISGQVRVAKLFSSNNKSPYTSVLELNAVETKDVLNRILTESYQTNSEVIVSEIADQSILVTKLPDLNVNRVDNDSITREQYLKKNNAFFRDVFESASNDLEKIVKMFEGKGLSYLGSRVVNFYCPCSKEKILVSLKGMYPNEKEAFEGQEFLEIACDYCNRKYVITKADYSGTQLH